MAESAVDPCYHPCENCGEPVDGSGLAPLSLVRCPGCDHPNLVNTQFHHFKLLEIIGSGGMGAVYRALDQSLNRTVALKLLRTEHMKDQSIVAQFEREAAITAAINHPNVVRIFSTGSDRGTVYIVMELVDKGSLDDLMNLQGRVAEAQVLEIGIQIARGLQAAWRAGLLHRDVKPGNILFNDAHTAKIVDFGLAALAGEDSHLGGEVWGTPYYVAPEKLESPPQEDFRSDIYSLGSALFHAIAGRPPYEAEDASIVVLKVLKSQAVSLQSFAPDVSSSTNFVINRMLKKNPDERYASYEELIEHLRYARSGIAEGMVPLPPPPPEPKPASRWVTVGVSALVIGAGVYLFLQQPHRRTPAAPPLTETPKPAMMADAAERSAEARRLLIAGDEASTSRAIDAFRDLDRDTVPQPLRSWNAMQGVLARMLAGRTADAAASAAQIVERGPISSGNADDCPGKFFVETATIAAADAPPAAALADRLDPATHESFALLIGGMKNWSAGNFADAARYLGRFQSAKPDGTHAWIAEYQPLAASFLADHEAFTRATAAANAAAGVPAQKKGALEATRKARAELRRQSPLADQLATLESRLAEELAALEAEAAKEMAALDEADAAALQTAQPQIDALCRQFRIAEAKNLAMRVELRGEKYAPELALLRRKLSWLEDFKTAFFDDLRKGSYQATVYSANNAPLGSGLWVPTDTGIKVMNSNGHFEAPWATVHPQSIITAVQAGLRPALPVEAIADRKWGLGLFLLTLRLEALARPQLTEASAARPEYREVLPQLGLTPP